MMINNNLEVIAVFVGTMMLCTNIITSVLKKLLKKIPGEIIASVVSLIMTICEIIGYCDINGIPVEWRTIACAIAIGFLVSYAAQFGYDKFMDVINKFKGVK